MSEEQSHRLVEVLIDQSSALTESANAISGLSGALNEHAREEREAHQRLEDHMRASSQRVLDGLRPQLEAGAKAQEELAQLKARRVRALERLSSREFLVGVALLVVVAGWLLGRDPTAILGLFGGQGG